MPPSSDNRQPTPIDLGQAPGALPTARPVNRRGIVIASAILAVILMVAGVVYGASVLINPKGGTTAVASPRASVAPAVSSDERSKVSDKTITGTALDVNSLAADNGDITTLVAQALQVSASAVIQGGLTVNGSATIGGTVTAGGFSGSGAGLTGVNAALLGGQPRSYYEGLAGGSAALSTQVAGLSANAALRNAPNTFGASNTFLSNVTVTGTTVLGATTASSLILGSPLAATQGGTGLGTVPSQGVLYGQGGATLAAAVPASAGLCLVSGATDVQWGSCAGGVGVASLNGLTGVLTVANATAAAGTITINDATTAAKGIASFNGANFSVAAGVVNTVQDISSSSSPAFTGLTLTTPLAVSSGGTGASTLTANGLVLANGAAALTTVSSAGAGLCLMSNVGAPSFQACPGGGAVTSVNGQSGAVTVANASGSGGTVTINDATTAAKGIASFNNNNFTTSAGAVNTIQNIGTGATPTFAGLNANSLTPSAALTIGATAQQITIQGNGSSVFTATNAGNTTTLGFATPTANTTLNLPALAAGTYTVCTTSGNCSGAGGGVTTAGGTTNALPKFTGAQTLGDSILSDNGTTVTVAGAGVIQGSGGLTLGVSSSATGKIAFKNGTNGNTTTLQSGAAGSNLTFTLPVADGSAGDCLVTNASGVLSFSPCLSGGGPGGGVASLNGLSGTLTVANASGAGATVTINDASTAQKGIAQFNSTNFSASSGAINTIQDIATTASPSFTGATLTGAGTALSITNNATIGGLLNVTGAGGVTIGSASNLAQLSLRDGSSAFAATFQPTTPLTANRVITVPNAGGTLAVSASGNIALSATGDLSFTGLLPVLNGGTGANNAGSARTNLGAAASGANADITSTNGLNTITPTAALAIGATGQQFTLQGNAASSITATNSGSTTTVSFQTPTANVTYRLPTAAAGTYDICTMAGNCPSGGNVSAAGGTTNKIAKFSGAASIVDSSISDTGASITVTPSSNGATAFQVQNSTSTPLFNIDATATGQVTAYRNTSIDSNIFRLGPTSYSVSSLTGFTNSAYAVIDKANTASDASLVLRDQGAIRGEIGLVTDNDIHFKTVTGSAGSETFTDRLTIQASGEVVAFGKLGVGTVPVEQLHVAANSNAARVYAKVENTNAGAGTVGSGVWFAGTGTSWVVGTDAGGNGGNNLFIQDNNAGYPPRLLIDSSGRVGIGKDTPGTALDVVGTATATGLAINGTSTFATTSTTAVQVQNGSGNNVFGVDTTNGQAVLGKASTLTGKLVFDNSTNGNAIIIQPAVATAGRTYTLPDSSATTDTFCLQTLANCVGGSGNVTTAGGTTNALARFTSGTAIGDSSLSDDGTTVSVASAKNLTVTGGATTLTGLAAGSSTSLFINPGADTNTGITIKATAAQSAALLAIVDSSNGTLMGVDAFGNIFGQQISSNDTIVATTYGGSHNGLAVQQAAASATAPVVVVTAGATPGAGANLLELHDASGNTNAAFNNVGNQLTLGRIAGSGTVTQGKIVLSDGTTDNFGLTLQASTLTANRTYSFPNSTGGTDTVCLQTLANCTGGSGVTTVGAFSGSSQTNGASIATSTITFGPADATNPGMVSTGTQTFAGNKTFNDNVLLGNASTDRLTVTSQILGGTPFTFQGATDDSFTTAFQVADPTANRTITLPNVSGTIALQTSGSAQAGVSAFVQGGSSWGAAADLGTNDSNPLNFRTNGATKLTVSATGDFTYASGAGGFDQSASSGTFKTGTGAVSLNGDTTIASGKTLLVQGAATFSTLNTTGVVQTNGSGLLSTGNLNLGTGPVTGTVGVGNGGTGIATYSVGDMLYASGATTLTKLADVATGSCLTSGGVGVAPSWTACPAAANGVTTVASFSGSSQTNGATIAANAITFGPADATNPGMVSTGTQTIAGSKTLTGSTLFKPAADSTTAFQIQNSTATTTLLAADTTNGIVKVGSVGGADLVLDGGGTTSHIFTSNFETGSLFPWTNTSNTVPTVDTAQSRTGRYAVKMAATGATAQYVDWSSQYNNNLNYSTVYARAYFYATAQPASNADLMYVFSSNPLHKVEVYRAASTGNLCVRYDGTTDCSSTPFPLSQWNKIEITGNLHTGGTGLYKLVLNDTVLKNVTTATATLTTTMDGFQIGDDNTIAQTFWADDAVFDSATPSGSTGSSSLTVADTISSGGDIAVGGNLTVHGQTVLNGQLIMDNGPMGDMSFQAGNGPIYNGYYSGSSVNYISGSVPSAETQILSSGLVTSVAPAGSSSYFSVQTISPTQVLFGESGPTGLDASLVFNNATNTNAVTLKTGVTSGSYSLTLPTSIAASNQCLQAGTVSAGNVPLTFAACSSGVTTVGTFSGSSQANGATIASNTITFGPADATNPGMVTTGTQTFAGAKTFSGVVSLGGGAAADLTTAGAATATVITIKPGTSTGASSNGPNAVISAGDGSGTTTVVGGNLTLSGGSATGGSGTRTGGNVSIDAGTGATANGSISLGVTSATAIAMGHSGITTTNNGNFTVAANQTLTASGAAVFKDATDSSTAFQIQNSAGTINALTADTLAGRVGIGTATATNLLTVTQGTSGPGTVTTNGTVNLVGTNTSFNDTFKVGDTINVTGETSRTIASISDNSHLAVTSAFATSTGGLSYTVTGGNRLTVTGYGNVGIGTATPSARLSVIGGTSLFQNTTLTSNSPELDIQATAIPTSGPTNTAFRATLTNTPTSTANTAVGGTVSVTDATTLANTLQGFNVSVADTGSGAKTIRGLFVDTSGTTNTSATVSTAIFKSASSTTAFQIQDSTGTSLLTADTVNDLLGTQNVNIGSPTGSSTSGRVFTDSFEEHDQSRYTNLFDITGSSNAAMSSTTVHGGAYSIQFTINTGAAAIKNTTASGSATQVLRGYVNVSSQTSTSLEFASMTNGSKTYAICRGTGGNLGWSQATSSVVGGFRETTTACSNLGSTVMTTGAWHKVELAITISAGAGTATLYLDGTQVLSQTGLNTGTGTFDGVQLGDGNGTGTSPAHVGTYYVDDVAVDTVRPGDAGNAFVSDTLHVGGLADFQGGIQVNSGSNGVAFIDSNSGNFYAPVYSAYLTSTDAIVQGGTSFSAGSNGGGVQLVGKNGSSGGSGGNGGSITITAGNGLGSSGTGGNVTITAGSSASSTAGSVVVKNASNSTTAFQVQNSGGTPLLTADTTNTQITVNGSLSLAKLADSGGTTADWAKVSGTTGNLCGQGSVDTAKSSVVYNGSLYIGTSEQDKAEVCQYNGGTSWTRINSAAGTFGSNANTDTVGSMIVYGGSLYIGTTGGAAGTGVDSAKASLYRWDGSSTFTIINSQGALGSDTSINGITALAVFEGSLQVGTSKAGQAGVYIYTGGTGAGAFTITNAAVGNFNGVTAVDTVSTLYVTQINGESMFAGLNKSNGASIAEYNGGGYTTINGTPGTFESQTSYDEVNAMTVYNGQFYFTAADTGGGGAVLYHMYIDNAFNYVITSALGTAGTIGGTSGIDRITAMTVYNGMLYLGTKDASAGGSAQLWQVPDVFNTYNRVSQATAGTLIASGTAAIDGISVLQPFGDKLYVGTDEANSIEMYTFSSVEGQSNKLLFNASSDNAGSTEQASFPNQGSIYFLAEQTASASTQSINTGSGQFVFSHGITTSTAAYDLAEDYPSRDDGLTAGDLVSIDPAETGFVRRSQKLGDAGIVGVYSTTPALRLSQSDSTINGGRAVPVALSGRVPLHVNNENGAIHAGDALMASSTPGVAMRATVAGRIVGMAMGDFTGAGQGTVTVFVNPNFFSGANAASSQVEALQQSSAASTVLLDHLEISHDLLVHGITTTTGLNVTGTATLAKLDVSGQAHFAANVTIDATLTAGAIVVNGHIATGGGSPTIKAQTAAGLAAEVTVSGTDTAGLITLKAGNKALDAGALLSLTFAMPYDVAPRVVLTPANSQAAAFNQTYIDAGSISTTAFELKSNTAAAAGTTYQWYYQVIQ